MKRLLVSSLALTLTLAAQKIETETPSRERVVKVQTAMNHLTVIEVSEPVTTVAVGSPQTFKIERRENKVFIQPLQEGAATNLFIWTGTTRLNYELVPAISDAGQMDFAIDYRQLQAVTPPSPKPAEGAGSTIPNDMLLNGIPVRMVGAAAARKASLVQIRDVYRQQDEVFVRYTIENRSEKTFRTGRPTVVSLSAPRFDISLWALQNSQLGIEYSSRLRNEGEPVPVKITQAEPAIVEVGPGQARVGLMTLHLPVHEGEQKKTQPMVLQFAFPVDRAGQLTATLVL
jgi:Conjugal transfer protein